MNDNGNSQAFPRSVMPFLIKNYGGNFNPKHAARHLKDSLSTLTTQDHHGLVTPLIVENYGTSKSRPVTDRLPAVTAELKHGIVSAEAFKSFLSYYYSGSDMASHVTEAARTFSTKERASLVFAGKKPKINDCYYRMLLPHEVKLGMAFDESYIVLGNSKEQVKQLGNAVTPPAMDFLIDKTVHTLL